MVVVLSWMFVFPWIHSGLVIVEYNFLFSIGVALLYQFGLLISTNKIKFLNTCELQIKFRKIINAFIYFTMNITMCDLSL